MDVVKLRLIPDTMIIGPIKPSREQIRRYIECGFVRKEDVSDFRHVDKIFPRNAKKECYILKSHLLAPVRRVVRKLYLNEDLLNFDIVNEEGDPVNYAVIKDGYPLITTRAINDIIKGEAASVETFEFIDPTFYIDLLIETKYPEELITIIASAGRKEGLYGYTGKGFGKFVIERLE